MDENKPDEESNDMFDRLDDVENKFCDLNHRIESIEYAMEKIINILRDHDEWIGGVVVTRI